MVNMKQGRKGGRYTSTHGMRKHPLYMKLMIMIQRCENPNSPDYKYYGERGVRVCYTWRNDPASFIRWAKENGWKPDLTIDRVNSDGDYEPDNCRFVTMSENAKNSKTTAKLNTDNIHEIRRRVASGETHTAVAKGFKVNRQTVSDIIKGRTWAWLIDNKHMEVEG